MSVQDGAEQIRTPEGLSRRDALKLASAAVVGGGGVIGATQGIAQTVPTFDRLDHVYFLLNMHWFQAGLYSYALKGETLPGDLLGPRTAGKPPEPKSWARITFTDTVFGISSKNCLPLKSTRSRHCWASNARSTGLGNGSISVRHRIG